MSSSPRAIGRYLLFDSFAAGGMATVHLARLLGPRGFSRAVAIKQLHPQFARNSEFVAMLLDEAKLASRIRHSNVVSPLDVVVLEAELFVVMDYIHGESLARLLRQASGPLPTRVVSAVMTQALLGLHAAHEATGAQGEALGMVHRDVSPQNILVGADGVTRVVDFGIAKPQNWSRTTSEGVLKGKLGYMAPEQIQLDPVDRRTDIFTAGIVLWEMLTGARLFSGDSLAVVDQQMIHTQRHLATREVPDLPPALRAVAVKALATEPAQRYQSAHEMAAAIAAVVPPATSLEVGAWVTELAGPELRDRAARLALLEAFDANESVLQPVVNAATLTPARSLLPVTSHAESTPSAMELRRAPTSVARRRVTAAAFGASLLLLGVLGYRFKGDGQPAAAVVLEPLQARAASAAASLPQPVETSTRASSSAGAPTAPPVVTPGMAPSVAAPRVAIAAPRPSATGAAGAEASARPTTHANSARRSCDVPFTVDGSGVKRFKPECF